MTTRELERLNDLLLKLHEATVSDGKLRDEISHIRHAVHERLDGSQLASPVSPRRIISRPSP